MINNKEQYVDNNSIANQASRDIHQVVNIYKTDSNEIKKVCMELYEKNHNELVLIAQEKAKAEVESYAEVLFTELSNSLSKEIEEKLKEPEIQAAINDTVKIVTRKGKKADKNLLSLLIKEKIEQFDNEESSSIIDDAIDIMSKITSSQMILCGVIYLLRITSQMWNDKTFLEYKNEGFPIKSFILGNIPFYGEVPLEHRENVITTFMQNLTLASFNNDACKNAFPEDKVSSVNLDLMVLRGLAHDLKSYQRNIVDILKEKIPLGKDDNIDDKLSLISSMLNKMGIESISSLDKFVLTPIGLYIGEQYMKSKLVIK